MTGLGEVLRDLHRIHKQLTDLRERLAQGPKAVHAGEANVKACDEGLKAAKESHTRARVAVDQKQLQLRQREARIADLNGKLNACATNREYQTLKEQIAADRQANLVLEDEILEGLEAIDTFQRKVGQADRQLQLTREDLEKNRKRIAQEQAGLESELARVTDQLHEAESRLPDDIRPEYLRLSKVRGEDALAPADGGFCGGCNQSLTSQMVAELRLARLAACRNCGCLLYLPDS
ncbi:MAG: phospholipase [Planctomycetes bacterium]|nr:phospholipase [Planctomycetota bacterium]